MSRETHARERQQTPVLLTVNETAALLRCNPWTVYHLARQGELPGRKIGGMWRFHRETLLRLIAEGGGDAG